MVKVDKLNEMITTGSPVALFADNSQGVCTCSVASKVPTNCKAIHLYLQRGIGSGTLSLYPNSGSTAITVGVTGGPACDAHVLLPVSGQNIKYSASAAETWTLKMIAYVVEGERKY
jgi:hypothetical protein